MASSDSLSPTDEIGGASSQCGADADKSLALSTSDIIIIIIIIIVIIIVIIIIITIIIINIITIIMIGLGGLVVRPLAAHAYGLGFNSPIAQI